MWDLEYLAIKEWDYVRDVVYREADLMAPFERELELAKQACAAQPRHRLRWLGVALSGAGHRLVAIGSRLDLPSGGMANGEPGS